MDKQTDRVYRAAFRTNIPIKSNKGDNFPRTWGSISDRRQSLISIDINAVQWVTISSGGGDKAAASSEDPCSTFY